jgi:hypothetical protein
MVIYNGNYNTIAQGDNNNNSSTTLLQENGVTCYIVVCARRVHVEALLNYEVAA